MQQACWCATEVLRRDPDATLAEIERSGRRLRPDGVAATCRCNAAHLGDPRLDPVWAGLEMREHLGRLYPHTAATMPTRHDHLVYGSDCGVPCTSDATMMVNMQTLPNHAGLTAEPIEGIGHNALRLFPAAAAGRA